jgi:hypothetical protein
MAMKGFVLTTDGIIALIIALSVFVIINSPAMNQQQTALSNVQLKRLSMDSLTILEKSGMLDRAVQSNSSAEIVYFTTVQFPSKCMKVKITGSGGYGLVAAMDKCQTEASNFFVSKRTFVSGNSFYVAELHAWER